MARVNLGRDSSGRPLVVDARTIAKLRLAEKRLGHTFTIVQGSWRAGSGAAASADTHDRGGVIDLRTWNIPAKIGVDRAVRELRLAGLIAWHRTKAQGFDDHIHAVDYGNPDLSRGAANQVVSWQEGANGLASHGRDDGPRVKIPRDPPKESTMNRVQSLRAAINEAIREHPVPPNRRAARVMVASIRAALKVGPRK